jgi:hypothetical protein
MLVVVCGLPGVGKTTVSGAVAERLSAARLRTDVVRKERYDRPTYTDRETDSVYEALFERARSRLSAGEPVVLDGTFRERARRAQARKVAASEGVESRTVHVVCEESTVRARIEAREDDASDADFAVHRELREEFEPFERPPVVVDNSGDRKKTRARVDAVF